MHGLVMRGRVPLALVLDVGDVSRVGVSDVVVDDLLPAVGQEDMVGAVRAVAVPVLLGAEVYRVLVAVDALNAVGVVVDGGALLVLGLVVGGAVMRRGVVHRLLHDGGGVVSGLGLVDDGGGMVSRLGLVNHGGGMVNRLWLVDRLRSVVSGLVVDRLGMIHRLGLVDRLGSVVSGLVVNGLGMVHRLRSVVGRLVVNGLGMVCGLDVDGLMVHRLRCMVDGSVVNRGMVNWLMDGRMVDWLMDGAMVDGLMDGAMVYGLMDRSVVNRLMDGGMMDWLMDGGMVDGLEVSGFMVDGGMVDGPVMSTTVTRVLLHLGVIVNLLWVGISFGVDMFGSPTIGGNHGCEGQGGGDEQLHLSHLVAADRMTALLMNTFAFIQM